MNEKWFFQPITLSRGKLILGLTIMIILFGLILIWVYYEWYLVGLEQSIHELNEN